MRIESSSEFQGVVLSTVIKDTYMFTRTSRFINDTFFDKYSYKLIYKSLKYYYDKYSKLPTLTELLILISDFHNPQLGDVELIKQECQTLYDTPRYDENFVIDKITTFIRRNNVENVLKSALPKLNQGDSIAIDSLGEELMKGLNFNLGKSTSFRLSDISEISAIRRAAIGTDDNPLIIKSCMDGINQSLQFKGYKPGDLIMICAAPGCFTGDTKVLTLDGESHTLEELYNSECLGIYGSDKDGNISTGMYDSVQLTKYTDTLMKVVVDGNVIKCTPDHQFMLRDGSYKRADQLVPGDSLMPLRREYRTAQNAGSDITTKDKGYECVVDCNSNISYTHHLSGLLIDRLDECTHLHHIDCNKLHNYPSNLKYMTPHDHRSLHAKNLSDLGRKIKPGEHLSPSTEFTSEYIRNRNLRNWQNPAYREKIIKVLAENGKKSIMINKLNHDEEFQKNNRVNKCLSYINSMIHRFGRDSIIIDQFDSLSKQLDLKRHIYLSGVAKAFDCIVDDGKPRRYATIDYAALNSNWDRILQLAMNYNHKVTSVEPLKLEKPVPVYDIINAGKNHNFALALNNEEGIFVHNCGKTMFMINEGANASIQGFKVLHLFLGDMKEYDGFVRYTSRYTQIPQDDIVAMPIDQQQALIRKFNLQGFFSNVVVAAYAAGEITIEEMVQEVYRLQDENHMHFDMILVDYADNLIPDSDMMYESGGNIYNKLSLLGSKNRSVILVGSQPKPSYWGEEIIPKEAAAESSRKQHVIDVMITMGMTSKGSTVGSLFLPKVRRGVEGKIIRIKTYFEKAYLEAIPETDYLREKSS